MQTLCEFDSCVHAGAAMKLFLLWSVSLFACCSSQDGRGRDMEIFIPRQLPVNGVWDCSIKVRRQLLFTGLSKPCNGLVIAFVQASKGIVNAPHWTVSYTLEILTAWHSGTVSNRTFVGLKSSRCVRFSSTDTVMHDSLALYSCFLACPVKLKLSSNVNSEV